MHKYDDVVKGAAGWNRCPECGAADQLDGDSVEIEGQLALQVVTCGICDSRWTEVYQAVRRQEFHPHAPYLDLIPVVEQVGEAIAANMRVADYHTVGIEHTGGGVMVAFVRNIGIAKFPDAHVGISVSDDTRFDPKWLVCGYRDNDDDGTAHFGYHDDADLIGAVEAAIVWLNKESLEMLEAEAKAWAISWANEAQGDIGSYRGWTARIVTRTAATWDIAETGGARHTAPVILHLQSYTYEAYWLVHWVDEIGLNEWNVWLDYFTDAANYLGRLIAAVVNDRMIEDLTPMELIGAVGPGVYEGGPPVGVKPHGEAPF